MPITCQLCGEIFENIVDHTHLQKHKLTVKKYRELYGSNTVTDFSWSEYLRTKNQHRKGVPLSNDHKQALTAAFVLREQKYQSGELQRGKHVVSEHNRKQHSERMRQFAKENPDTVSDRVKKAQATRKANGPGNRAGAKLSEETKHQITKSLLIRGEKIQQQTVEKYSLLIQQQDVSITDRLGTTLFFKCNVCQMEFSRSIQLLQPNKFQPELCSICHPKHPGPTSKAEQDIVDFLQQLNCSNIVTRCRDIISPHEIDIYLPEHNLAIEYSGIYWHSEIAGGKGQYYHQEKWRKCNEKSIQLITIFDDEWKRKSQTIQTLLQNKIKKSICQKVFARKCQVKIINSKVSAPFLDQNHIHGSAAAQVHLGLYYNEQLIYVMTFTRNNISRGNSQTWEIQRMASDSNYLVIGGASKIFSFFVDEYQPTEVISYADLRWFTGESYKFLGFSKESITKPGYWYINKNYTERKHRYSLRKNKADNQSLTEWENRQLQGYDRIWDCGHAKWRWNRRSN